MVQPAITETLRCGYCGCQLDTNHLLGHKHVGGQGIMEFPICLDFRACIDRVQEGVDVANCPIKQEVCYPSCQFWWTDCKYPEIMEKE